MPRLAELGGPLAEMSPLLRRVVGLDAGALARVRAGSGRLTVLARLPFAVLVARTVTLEAPVSTDITVSAAALLAWCESELGDIPPARDTEWRGAVPPDAGWRRIDTVPDDAIRTVVRSGALALKDAAAREGVPGAQPRGEVADALLDSVVLTVDGDAGTARITLRTVSALTRMGFLPRGSHAGIDVAGRWTRVAGAYGSVYDESAAGLGTSSLLQVRPGR